MTLIEQLRARRDALIETINATVTTSVEEERELTDAEDAEITANRSAVEALNGRIDDLIADEVRRAHEAEALAGVTPEGGLQERETTVENVNEADLYREDGEFDFVRDVLAADVGRNSEAATRLHAHNEEQNRATALGDLGGYAIPLHALDLATLSITNGRPFADIVTQRPLTAGTVRIPQQSSSTQVVAIGENAAGGNGDFEASTDLVVTAKTISGYTDLSVQSIHFSEVDTGLVLADLRKEYDEYLDTQLLNGTGLTVFFPGVLTRTAYSGANTIDASDIWKAVHLWTKVSEAKAAVQSGVNAAATHLVLNPAVWGWITSVVDSEGRPVFGHGFSSPQNVQGSGQVFNDLIVIPDANCPATHAVVCKSDELVLWETGPATLQVDQVGAHTGTHRLVIRGYAAFESLRRTGAVKVIDDIPTPSYEIPAEPEPGV